MKSLKVTSCIGALLLAMQLCSQGAETVKTYQVTGPVLEINDKTIVVQKGDERWEIAREEGTKIKGTVKVGQKVTIQYRMIATVVEAKETGVQGKR